MLRATKVRIYPTTKQAEYLNAQFGAVRFAYNKALHIKKHAYQRHGVNLNPRKDLKPLLSVAKKSRKYAWLKEFDSMALQQAVINLDVAFSNFFNPKLKARFPTFKRKHGKQSSYHCVGIKVLENAIKIPKLAPIEARIHRVMTGKVTSITITRSATGKYYASILCEDGIPTPAKPAYLEEEKITGVDMGLEHYAIRSDRAKIANPRHLINASRNLRRKQKALSRKQKGSANRKKARIRLAAIHERVANARADFQHKLSRTIVDENQAVIV
ncbi:TPA: RNA-guided endonuclease InsQ/TnpB family protein, partial [Escherichia coli]